MDFGDCFVDRIKKSGAKITRAAGCTTIMSPLTSILTVIASPIIYSLHVICIITSNLLIHPLGYLFSICIYTPFIKIPFIIPARYFLELDTNVHVHLISSLTGAKHQPSYFIRASLVLYSMVFRTRGMKQEQIERFIAQLTLFFTTTFHFIMTAIYIGLLAGVILGTIFSFISWMFTMSPETEANITIGLQNKINKVLRFVPTKSTLPRLKFRLWGGRSKTAAVNHNDTVSSPLTATSSTGWLSAAPDVYPKVKLEGPFYQPYLSRFDDDDYDEQQAYLSQELQMKHSDDVPRIKQETKPRYEMEMIAEESNASDSTEIVDYQGDPGAGRSASGIAGGVESGEEVYIYPTPSTDHELQTDRSGLRQRIKQERLRTRTATTPSDSEQSNTALYHDEQSVANEDSGDADVEEPSGGETSAAEITTDASDDTSEDAQSGDVNEEASVTNMTRVSGDDFIKSYQIDEPVIDLLNELES